jgi:hypothetical protein
MFVGFEMVTCKECKVSYQCTPMHDYYNSTTTTDGVCESCLLKAMKVDQVIEVNNPFSKN